MFPINEGDCGGERERERETKKNNNNKKDLSVYQTIPQLYFLTARNQARGRMLAHYRTRHAHRRHFFLDSFGATQIPATPERDV